MVIGSGTRPAYPGPVPDEPLLIVGKGYPATLIKAGVGGAITTETAGSRVRNAFRSPFRSTPAAASMPSPFFAIITLTIAGNVNNLTSKS